MTPAPEPPPPPPPPRRTSAAGLLVVGILIGAIAGSALTTGATRDLSLPALPGVADLARPTASPAPSAGSASADDRADIQAVIQRANEEQSTAIARKDPAVMRDTATAQHYDEMVRINGDLIASGVAGVRLVRIEWGTIDVSGSTAHAIAYETWETTFSDGSTERSRDENDYTLVRQRGSWLVQSDDQPGAASTSTGTPPGDAPAPAAISPGQDTSSNWSGYVATGGTFTSVTGTWKVAEPGTGTRGADATWVGIGGVQGHDLIQAGTQAITDGAGSTQYQAWIEMLPRPSQTVPLSVSPGDTVTTTITQKAGSTWTVSIADHTTGRSWSTTVDYASSLSSAEWVVEAPSAGRGIVPIDQFGSISFSDARTTKDGAVDTIAQADGQSVTMINGLRQALAQPSALGGDGASFTISRTTAQAGAAGLPGRRRG